MAATRSLWAVGILDLAGYVLEPSAEETLATVDVVELKHILDAAADVQVIDVREAFERDSGYIPGSRNIPYRLLRKVMVTAARAGYSDVSFAVRQRFEP